MAQKNCAEMEQQNKTEGRKRAKGLTEGKLSMSSFCSAVGDENRSTPPITEMGRLFLLSV